MNALKGLDFKRSATTLFSMYIKYLMYSFFTGWLFHSAWQSLVLAVTKIRFRRFRRFSKVCQEPFPAFEQVSSQKVESIQWYVCDIGTTKIFVIYFLTKFCDVFLLANVWQFFGNFFGNFWTKFWWLFNVTLDWNIFVLVDNNNQECTYWQILGIDL